MTQLCNEIIQMKDCGVRQYFTNFWNLNDFLMIWLTILYGALRMGTEQFRKNFVVVKDFEFVDDHLETEVLLEML